MQKSAFLGGSKTPPRLPIVDPGAFWGVKFLPSIIVGQPPCYRVSIVIAMTFPCFHCGCKAIPHDVIANTFASLSVNSVKQTNWDSSLRSEWHLVSDCFVAEFILSSRRAPRNDRRECPLYVDTLQCAAGFFIISSRLITPLFMFQPNRK